MRPVPQAFLLTLIIALCALCAWQWHREFKLREVVVERIKSLAMVEAKRAEVEERVKAADAEILRLTGTVSDLRINSVAKLQHDEVLQANVTMRESIEKQNGVIKELNDTVAKADVSIKQTNDTIKKLTAERDDLARKLNELTAQYNALAKKGGS